ncbi:MAG: Fur family transcriptional regulator [Rhodospirillales bacterium]
MSNSRQLTKNQQAVFACLQKAGRALTAYDILDQVRDQGIRAPVQVYRALERLQESAAVHRIESMNAFVACVHGHDDEAADPHHKGTIAFAICDDCGQVNEIPVPKAARTIGALAGNSGFITERTVVELRGHCGPCQNRLDEAVK